MDKDIPNLLTASEVAKKLRTSRWQVYQYVREGILPPGLHLRLGRSLLFSRAELDSWIKRGGQGLNGKKQSAGSLQ